MGMLIDMSKSHRAGESITGHMRTLGIAQGHPKQGRNEPCACGSGKNIKNVVENDFFKNLHNALENQRIGI